MNKKMVQKIYSRLGYWLKYERKKHYDIDNNNYYKQETFIRLKDNEKYIDFIPGDAICSRTTLSRIENGKLVYETTLLMFFLRRFNRKYRINEVDQKLIDSTIHTFYVYIFMNNKLSRSYLHKILEDTNAKVHHNFLWDEDYTILNKILRWVTDFTLIQKHELDEIVKKFKLYHNEIQDILIFYLVFSVYFNPELWIRHEQISQLIKDEYATNGLLTVLDDLFYHRPNNVYRTFYRHKQIILESGFLKELVEPLKFMLEKQPLMHRNYPNLDYMRLVHKLNVNDYTDHSLFEKCIFSFLRHHKLGDEHDLNRLFILIKHEPYPRIINELVLKQVFPKVKSKSHLQEILDFMLS